MIKTIVRFEIDFGVEGSNEEEIQSRIEKLGENIGIIMIAPIDVGVKNSKPRIYGSRIVYIEGTSE